MPTGVPVSVSDFRDFRDENGECEYFLPVHMMKLDLNAVTKEDLVANGLSKNKAALIVDVREERGRFGSISDLLRIRSIGKTTYEKLCGWLYVEKPKEKPLVDEQQREWMLRISDATEWMTGFLNKTFGSLWCKLRFEHVDASAYWYTFELVNDDRRQTWCVRHSDLEG
jgi:competence ComEA-like helix-hairpin-helix protein